MAGWFELTKNDKGQHRFVLKAANSEVILRSEAYETRSAAQNGIASVKKNAVDANRFERKDASDGRFFFNLKAGNHQVIGTSQMYKSTSGRDGGIESVRKNAASAEIREL